MKRSDSDSAEAVPVDKTPERLAGDIRGLFEEIAAKVVPVAVPDAAS